MGLKLFNTLSRSIQEFAPLDPAGKKVGMYCCGPTVYDFAHIGNWRTFVFADLVRRYLEFKGYAVTHVMNVTDVEDKIIKGIREAKTTLRDFTGKYETAFFADMKTLNCLEPHHKPRATDYIPAMIELIEKLVARGIAYKANDGSVYFSIEKYRACGCTYGQLLKLNFEEMRAGERARSDEYTKESLADFALWKTRVPEDGDVFWKSDSLGEGRPGWHIECSAMSMKILGASFDLHLGGEDLIFPHHEDEIAQSEGATQKPFVKYWLHGAFLLVEGKKMSKSLGNFFTLRDLLAKGFTGREVRYLLLQSHYRETFNFTIEGLEGARSAIARIDECIGKLREIAGTTPIISNGDYDSSGHNARLRSQFEKALDADLNISAAWASVHDWVSNHNKADLLMRQTLNPEFAVKAAANSLATWHQIDKMFGLGERPTDQIPAEILALATDREECRKLKDFKHADTIRKLIESKGYLVEDTLKGPKLKKL